MQLQLVYSVSIKTIHTHILKPDVSRNSKVPNSKSNLSLIWLQQITIYLSKLIKRYSSECTNTVMNSTGWEPNFRDDRDSVKINISTNL